MRWITCNEGPSNKLQIITALRWKPTGKEWYYTEGSWKNDGLGWRIPITGNVSKLKESCECQWLDQLESNARIAGPKAPVN